MKERKLVFIYNADSGILNALKDAVRKAFAPKTYECSLCAVTYGPVSMKPEWRRFIENLPVEVEFLHRGEFTDRYGRSDIRFPAAVWEKAGSVEPVLTAEEINSCGSLEELKTKVQDAVS